MVVAKFSNLPNEIALKILLLVVPNDHETLLTISKYFHTLAASASHGFKLAYPTVDTINLETAAVLLTRLPRDILAVTNIARFVEKLRTNDGSSVYLDGGCSGEVLQSPVSVYLNSDIDLFTDAVRNLSMVSDIEVQK